MNRRLAHLARLLVRVAQRLRGPVGLLALLALLRESRLRLG
jgi:hypothetical protein